MLFTSRTQAALGVPGTTDKQRVSPLSQAAATELLSKVIPLLSLQQLGVVLRYCGGLPLALQLVRGRIEQDRDGIGPFTGRLADYGPISFDNDDDLFTVVGDSVQSLSETLRQAWFDITMLLYRDMLWEDLELLYGVGEMRELVLRSLVQPRPSLPSRLADSSAGPRFFPHAAVWVHDVLLSYAHEQCKKGSNQYRASCYGFGGPVQLHIDKANLVSPLHTMGNGCSLSVQGCAHMPLSTDLIAV